MKSHYDFSAFCVLFIALLCSCSQILIDDNDESGNKDTNQEDKVVHVSFNAYRFEKMPFESRSTESLKSTFSRLGFAIFKADTNEKITIKNQTSSDASFGAMSADLLPGNYVVVAVAHCGEGNATISSPTEIKFANNKMTDAACACQTFTVSGSQTNVELVLQRCVAMFRLVLDEPVPAQVAQLQFYYTGGSSTLDARNICGAVKSRQTEYRTVETAAHTNAKSQYDIYTIPRTDSNCLEVRITALDANGNALLSKIFTDMEIEMCQISCLTTKIFEGSGMGTDNPDNPTDPTTGGNNFNVSFNDTGWNIKNL